MADSITPLPPIDPRIARTQVTEKDPHHQKGPRGKKNLKDEEVQDEVVVVPMKKENEKAENKKKPPPSPQHKIDIEV